MSSSFYYSLKHYRPVLFCGRGPPFLMMHQGCSSPLFCLLILDALTLTLFALSLCSAPPKIMSAADYREQTHLVCILNGIFFCLLNVSYLLTLLLNPGIVDPDSITAETFQVEGRHFCDACNRPRTSLMQHCPLCMVCVRNLDHHCGFFQKCIAGTQTYFFYFFMLAAFTHFIILILTLGTIVT